LNQALRNSDVNAALYWLARMIEGGADPIFIVRRTLHPGFGRHRSAIRKAMVQAAAALRLPD